MTWNHIAVINITAEQNNTCANIKLANRYAKALIDLAVETNQLEEVNKDIELIQALDHDEFKRMMLSPVISSDKKDSLI